MKMQPFNILSKYETWYLVSLIALRFFLALSRQVVCVYSNNELYSYKQQFHAEGHIFSVLQSQESIIISIQEREKTRKLGRLI